MPTLNGLRTSRRENIMHADKLAVLTFDDELSEPRIRRWIIINWKTFTLKMDNSTILFISGIHYRHNGRFGLIKNIQDLKNQVRLFSLKNIK